MTFTRQSINTVVATRAPGYTAAAIALADEVLHDRVLISRTAMDELRRRFPPLAEPREYGADERAADGAHWPPSPDDTQRRATPVSPSLTPTTARLERQRQHEHWGSKQWAQLHARPSIYQGDAVKEKRWLDVFRMLLPCGECKNGWTRICDEHPFDLSSPEAYARSAWENHNRVNAKLSPPKPQFSWADAVKRWGYPTGWVR